MTRDERADAGDLLWRKSTYSNAGNQCVEVAQTRSAILVRDSKDSSGLHLTVTRVAWTALIARIGSADS